MYISRKGSAAQDFVAEIFNILKRLNQEQKMTMLLVEQNAHLALSIAEHG
jgi:branched-chain amino acid transport system ATP-binding protein